MRIEQAIALIEHELSYKPGWTFKAEDHTSRFEGTVKVTISYPAIPSETYPVYGKEIQTYATFPVIVTECSEDQVLHKVAKAILDIEAHETREFLRVGQTGRAPFHPHNIAGMRLWNELEVKSGDDVLFNLIGDLRFGLA